MKRGGRRAAEIALECPVCRSQAKGGKNGMAVLKREEVSEILAMHGRGTSVAFLARYYDVDRMTVRQIVRGEFAGGKR